MKHRPPQVSRRKPRRISALRSGVTTLAFLFLLTLIVAKVTKDGQQQFIGAFRIVDGDTVSLNGDALRLKGIDAPELAQSCQKDGASWSCGEVARQALADIFKRGAATCSGDRYDKYHRLLVTCHVADVNANAWMVRQGFAVAYGDYETEEMAAQTQKRGLWSGQFERPESWRAAHHGGGADADENAPASFLCAYFSVSCGQDHGPVMNHGPDT